MTRHTVPASAGCFDPTEACTHFHFRLAAHLDCARHACTLQHCTPRPLLRRAYVGALGWSLMVGVPRWERMRQIARQRAAGSAPAVRRPSVNRASTIGIIGIGKQANFEPNHDGSINSRTPACSSLCGPMTAGPCNTSASSCSFFKLRWRHSPRCSRRCCSMLVHVHASSVVWLAGFTPVLYLLYRMHRDGLSFGQICHLTVQRLSVDLVSLGFAGSLVLMTVAAVHRVMSGPSLRVLYLLVAIGLGVTSLIEQAATDGRARAQIVKSLSEIITVVASMPVEEYVPDTKDSYGKCSISQLKKMLEVREECNPTTGNPTTGNTSRAAPRDFVERGELVEAVRQCRKSNDSWIICFEEYNAGDPIRVLPKCGHENVECIYQWAYTCTCATPANRRNQNPSCPLCTVALK